MPFEPSSPQLLPPVENLARTMRGAAADKGTPISLELSMLLANAAFEHFAVPDADMIKRGAEAIDPDSMDRETMVEEAFVAMIGYAVRKKK